MSNLTGQLRGLVKRVVFSVPPLRTIAMRRRRARFETQFTEGRWNCLKGLDEMGRYCLIRGYIEHFAPEGAVLDCGCGQGILWGHLKRSNLRFYCGVDWSENAVAQAIAAYGSASGCKFLVADLNEYLDDRAYDAVVFNESLYYLPSPLATLDRFAGRLVPSGVIVISLHRTHDALWATVAKRYSCLDHAIITNRFETSWRCGVFAPYAAR